MTKYNKNEVRVTKVNFSGPLVSGYKWGGATGTGVTLDVSFPSSGQWWANKYGNGEPYSKWYILTPAEHDAVWSGLKQWAAVANVNFVEVSESGGFVGDLRFARTTVNLGSESAHAYVPGTAPWAGDVWFKHGSWHHSAYSPIKPGSFDFHVILHEIGHALGLKHPFEGSSVLPQSYNSLGFTVMAYAAYPGGGNDSSAYFYPTTPMYYDLLTLQRMYGREAHNSGNTTYTFRADKDYWQTIDDSGGIDTIAYVGSSGGRIDLRTGSWSQLGNELGFMKGGSPSYTTKDTVMIGPNTNIENASGGDGGDVIIGNALANVLRGNKGNDTISGREANDLLYGGSENDTLLGGAGADKLFGESGLDTASYATSPVAVKINLLTKSYTGGDAAGDTYSSIENVTGSSFADTLTGDNGANTLSGLAGNDRLDGGAGDDTLLGGAGADLHIGGTGRDLVSYAASQNSGVTVNLGANTARFGEAEGDRFALVEDLIGTNFGDTLHGSNDHNRIYGLNQNDELRGYIGNDILDGGAGNDIMRGDEGNDRMIADEERDDMTGGAGADVFTFVHPKGFDAGGPYWGPGVTSDAGGGRILDFSASAGDKIDLSRLDANLGVSGDQAFVFAGTVANPNTVYTGPGNLWTVFSSGTWWLLGVVDGWVNPYAPSVGNSGYIDIRISLNTNIGGDDLIL